MNTRKTYKEKGIMTFVLGMKDQRTPKIMTYTRTVDEIVEEHISDFPVKDKNKIKQFYKSMYTAHDIDLFDGLEFIEAIRNDLISNYDGNISYIYVDGYRSNLGLTCEGFIDGEFIVTEDVFREICNNYKVEVSWANK